MKRNPKARDEANLYSQIIEQIFFSKFKDGKKVVEFERQDIKNSQPS